MSHTPGPTRIESGHSYYFTQQEANYFLASLHRIVAPDGSTVAYVPDLPTARLIAQAPAMREALSATLDVLEWSRAHDLISGESVDTAIESARAILRAGEGEE